MKKIYVVLDGDGIEMRPDWNEGDELDTLLDKFGGTRAEKLFLLDSAPHAGDKLEICSFGQGSTSSFLTVREVVHVLGKNQVDVYCDISKIKLSELIWLFEFLCSKNGSDWKGS